MIKLDKGSTPLLLLKFQINNTGTQNEDYECLDATTKNDLRQNLLQENGFTCAYCMSQISFRHSRIEHIIPQCILRETSVKKTLDYSNLTICCDTSHASKEFVDRGSCDVSKSEKSLKIVDRILFSSDIEKYISYSNLGEIESVLDPLKDDIALLNLNNTSLIRARKKIQTTYKRLYLNELNRREIPKIKTVLSDISKLRNSNMPFKGVIMKLLEEKHL